ncbi:MAG: rhomboid family intramembrane serine protease [Acetatifactor sp.]|nr:rhomboid family intramembrane serine protease [Acetatifactor sp.]
MSKWEKKFGKYAIRNLPLVLILCYAVGYVIQVINGGFLLFLTLDPYKILHGQIWRIFTWIIVPPSSLDIFTLIMLYFYYSIGTTLERTWGTWRYNVFLLSGMLFTVLGSFVWLGAEYLLSGGMNAQLTAALSSYGSIFFSTYYINMSIFLAFAATFPNVQVLLMFVIPVKVKWMGIIYGVLLAWEFIVTGRLAVRVAIASSLLNFVIFFFTTRSHIHMSPKQVRRRAEFKHEIKRNPRITKHKCAICGRTDEDDPTLEFRFCSKCNGNYEYCQQHLFTHTHVK